MGNRKIKEKRTEKSFLLWYRFKIKAVHVLNYENRLYINNLFKTK